MFDYGEHAFVWQGKGKAPLPLRGRGLASLAGADRFSAPGARYLIVPSGSTYALCS